MLVCWAIILSPVSLPPSESQAVEEAAAARALSSQSGTLNPGACQPTSWTGTADSEAGGHAIDLSVISWHGRAVAGPCPRV